MMRSQLIDDTTIQSDNKILPGNRIHGRGIVTREYEQIKPDKSMCVGCEEDFYNHQGGMNGTGCWSFKSAKVCNKVGHSSIHVANGPDTIKRKTLTCWRGVCK